MENVIWTVLIGGTLYGVLSWLLGEEFARWIVMWIAISVGVIYGFVTMLSLVRNTVESAIKKCVREEFLNQKFIEEFEKEGKNADAL